MKNKREKNILIIIVVSIFILLTIGCRKNSTSTSINIKNNSLPDPVIVTKNSINFIVDPRIELSSIIQYLSDCDDSYGIMANYDFEYKRRVDEHFNNYKNHKAVKMFNKMTRCGCNHHVPPSIMLGMTNDYKLSEDIEMYCVTVKRSGGEKNLKKFYDCLEDFSEETNFNEFFKENIQYYEYIVDYASSKLENNDNTIEELEEYFVMNRKSYNVALVSLYGQVAYAGSVRHNGVDFHAYAFLGSNGVLCGKPYFGSKERFKNILRHEFCHSFVNLTSEKYWDEAKVYSKLLDPIKEDMKEKSYGTWMYCLNEHIVRAVTSRIIYINDNELGEKALKYERDIGFVYVDQIFDKLIEYENKRVIYPSFDSYYLELLKAFD